MKNLRKSLYILLISGSIVVFLPFFILLYHFFKLSISNDILHWGSFGDYISGTTGTIISILNLALLIILTIYVAKLDMHRHFNEFRYSSYIKLCEKIDNIKDSSTDYTELTEYLHSFINRNSFAYSDKDYEELKKRALELIESIKPIIKTLREREKNIKEGKTTVYDVEDTYFFDLIAESYSNEEKENRNDLTEYEQMKQKRELFLELIQSKMKYFS
jgi:hypothetical protein